MNKKNPAQFEAIDWFQKASCCEVISHSSSSMCTGSTWEFFMFLEGGCGFTALPHSPQSHFWYSCRASLVRLFRGTQGFHPPLRSHFSRKKVRSNRMAFQIELKICWSGGFGSMWRGEWQTRWLSMSVSLTLISSTCQPESFKNITDVFSTHIGDSCVEWVLHSCNLISGDEELQWRGETKAISPKWSLEMPHEQWQHAVKLRRFYCFCGMLLLGISWLKMKSKQFRRKPIICSERAYLLFSFFNRLITFQFLKDMRDEQLYSASLLYDLLYHTAIVFF